MNGKREPKKKGLKDFISDKKREVGAQKDKLAMTESPGKGTR